MGWVGSAGLREALITSPCGCELAAQAEREADPRAKRVKLAEAKRLQAAWRCPCAGHPEPREGAPLGGPQDHTARSVQVLLGSPRKGARVFDTCPLWYTRDPWVHEVVRAHGWWAKGQLRALSEHPSAVLVDAVDAVERAVRAREADDYERARRDAQSKQTDRRAR